MVIIKKSPIHGKGSFATKQIKKGTILECDVLEIPENELIRDYIFPLIGNRTCLHIGFGSFLNSSDMPNIKHLRIDYNLHMSYFEALVDIENDEELTLNYLQNNK